MKAFWSRRWARWLCALVACVLAVAGVFLGVRGWDNIHMVVEGQMYRSAQLSPATLERLIQEKGIRSILNLRGEHRGSRWYQQEIAVAKARGVAHYSYKLSALESVSPEKLDDIMNCIDHAQKPILVHCQGGSDRTGLVVATWLFAKKARSAHSAEDAAQHLSLRYGHFPWLWSSTDAMEKAYWNFVVLRGATISQTLRP